MLAGNGKGTPVYRHLQRAGIPFATGILWENDLDYPAARALASAVIAVPPFSAAEEEVILRAQKQLDACREVVCTVEPESLGEWGNPLRRLLEHAEKQGKVVNGNTCQRSRKTGIIEKTSDC